jgi:transposase-like protein
MDWPTAGLGSCCRTTRRGGGSAGNDKRAPPECRAGLSVAAAAKRLKVGRTTLYKALQEAAHDRGAEEFSSEYDRP